MATKKDLINSIVENENNTLSKEVLEEKTYKELNKILEGLSTSQESTPEVDEERMRLELEAKIREEMQAEMKAKMEEEMKAKIRAELEAENAKKTPKVTEIDKNRLIPVMNMTHGKLVHISKKTGAKWVWEQYGDVDEMEFSEIQSMRVSSKAFINEPLIMILDEDVVSYLGLDGKYEQLMELEDLNKVFKMNNKDFAELMENVPKSVAVTIIRKVRELVNEDKFESMWKVNYLNKQFNTEIGIRG